MKIKVCGNRDKENLEGLIQLNPDYLGFIFYTKSPRFVDVLPDVAIPEHIQKIGVFVNASREEIQQRIDQFGLHGVQLHGDESPEECAYWKSAGYLVFKAFNVGEDFDFLSLNAYKPVVDYFLFDTPSPSRGGSGQTFNWDVLKYYDQQVPFFLSGGIGPMHAEVIKSDWVQDLNPYGIDLNSKFETSPAIKNIAWLGDFISKLNQ